MVEKYIKDGKVAVLYSPGYGAGWSTWGSDDEDLVFDCDLAKKVDTGATLDELIRYSEATWPDQYTGGLQDISICWVEPGTSFKIDEYDGYESVVLMGEVDWFKA